MKIHEFDANDKLKRSKRMKLIITEAQLKKLISNTIIEHRLGRLQKIKLVKVNN